MMAAPVLLRSGVTGCRSLVTRSERTVPALQSCDTPRAVAIVCFILVSMVISL